MMELFIERLRNLHRVASELPVGGAVVVPRVGLVKWRQNWWFRTARRNPGCGTTACLAGFAGLDPWFRKNGLKTNRKTESVTAEGYGNMREYFGLSEPESCALFGGGVPSGAISARAMLVGKIEMLIAQRRAAE